MKNVIIRIVAFFAGAALLWGCSGEFGPSRESDQIRFRAGSMLLNDDGTRTAELMTSESTVSDFSVFALLNNNASSPIFDGTTVTYDGVSGKWGYSVSQQWAWNIATDRYDFVAISPVSAGAERLVGAPGRLTVTSDYSLSADNYDLLYSVYTRLGTDSDRNRIVPLSFKHALAAVRVDIINISQSGNFTVDTFCLKNVVNSATFKVAATNAGTENVTWIDAETSSQAVRKENPAAGAHNPVAPGDTLKGGGVANVTPPADGSVMGYNLLIPQRLNEGVNLPVLEITYTPDGQSKVTAPPINLCSILDKSTGEPITEWRMGVKYLYEISIRLDGGVEVRVVTTQWDEQIYETPGIMIPVD